MGLGVLLPIPGSWRPAWGRGWLSPRGGCSLSAASAGFAHGVGLRLTLMLRSRTLQDPPYRLADQEGKNKKTFGVLFCSDPVPYPAWGSRNLPPAAVEGHRRQG